MKIAIDLDMTICISPKENEVIEALKIKPIEKLVEEGFFDWHLKNAVLISGAKETINGLYDQGHTIIVYTARNSKTYRQITKKWLKDKGIRYHKLIMDKPFYNILIDDRAIQFKSWDKIRKLAKKWTKNT